MFCEIFDLSLALLVKHIFILHLPLRGSSGGKLPRLPQWVLQKTENTTQLNVMAFSLVV